MSSIFYIPWRRAGIFSKEWRKNKASALLYGTQSPFIGTNVTGQKDLGLVADTGGSVTATTTKTKSASDSLNYIVTIAFHSLPSPFCIGVASHPWGCPRSAPRSVWFKVDAFFYDGSLWIPIGTK